VTIAQLTQDVRSVVVAPGALPATFTALPVGEPGLPVTGPIINRVDVLLHHTDAEGRRWVFLPEHADPSLSGAYLPLPGAERQGFQMPERSAIVAAMAQLGLSLRPNAFTSLAGEDIEVIIGGKLPRHINARVLAYEVDDTEREAMRVSTDLVGRWFALDEANNPRVEMHPALRLVLQRLWGVLYFAGDFKFGHEDERRRIVEANHLRRITVGEQEVIQLVARSTVIHTSTTPQPSTNPDPDNVVGCLVDGCLRLGDHYHPYDEMFVVLQGTVIVFLAPHDNPGNVSEPFVFTAGQSFTVPAYVIHTVFCKADTLLSAIVTWEMCDENLISSRLTIPGIDTPARTDWDPRGYLTVVEAGTVVDGQFDTDGASGHLDRYQAASFPDGADAPAPVVHVGVLPFDRASNKFGLVSGFRSGVPEWWYLDAPLQAGTVEATALGLVLTEFWPMRGDLLPGADDLRLLTWGNLMWAPTRTQPLRPRQEVHCALGMGLAPPQVEAIRLAGGGEFRWFDPGSILDGNFHDFLKMLVAAAQGRRGK
jgi:mannose-6-phosphate isomerase-like protein (cupin superfamily)